MRLIDVFLENAMNGYGKQRPDMFLRPKKKKKRLDFVFE